MDRRLAALRDHFRHVSSSRPSIEPSDAAQQTLEGETLGCTLFAQCLSGRGLFDEEVIRRHRVRRRERGHASEEDDGACCGVR
jgi:hypothetical protein